VAALLVAALWQQVPQDHLWLWFAALLLTSVLRGLHLWLYLRRHPDDAAMPRWRDGFLLWTALSGAVWGATGILFTSYGSTQTAMLVGLGLTQIGEFSYVLVGVARGAQVVGNDVYNATLAASVITIILNGLLLKAMPRAAEASTDPKTIVNRSV